MQAIYNTVTGKVRQWTEGVFLGGSDAPVLGENEVIGNFITIPLDTTKQLIYQNGDIVVTSNPLPSAFNVVAFQTALAQLLLTGALSNVNLRFEFAAIIAYVTNGNFAGLYQYIQWLISQGIATTDDFTALNNACKSQGIDLENL